MQTTETTAAPSPTGTTTPTEVASPGTEFKAVEEGAETTSGATLLIESYAAIWLVVMVFALMSWFKQNQILARVASLEAAVAAARKAVPFGNTPAAGDEGAD